MKFKIQSSTITEISERAETRPPLKFKRQNTRIDIPISKLLSDGIGHTKQNFGGWNVDEKYLRSSASCIVAGFYQTDSYDYLKSWKELEKHFPILRPTSKTKIRCGVCGFVHNICNMLSHWNYDHKLSRESQARRLEKRGF